MIVGNATIGRKINFVLFLLSSISLYVTVLLKNFKRFSFPNQAIECLTLGGLEYGYVIELSNVLESMSKF